MPLPKTIPFDKPKTIPFDSAPIQQTMPAPQPQSFSDTILGTITAPLREAVSDLGTLYGGGEEGIAMKLWRNITEGAKDIERGNIVKGIAKSGFRTAGDIAGTIFAPIGAAVQATGLTKLTDIIGQQIADSKLGDIITNNPAVQHFAITHPNAAEDFGRALNILLASGEKGKIEPRTMLKRTGEQIKGGIVGSQKIISSIQDRFRPVETGVADIVSKRVTELSNINKQYSQLRKATQYMENEGKNTLQRIASTDVLSNAVDSDGTIRTLGKNGPVEQYRKMTIDGTENIVRKNLEILGETMPFRAVVSKLFDKVMKSGLEGSELKSALTSLKQEIEGLRLRVDPEGNILLEVLQDAKINKYKHTDFFTPSEVKTKNKALGSAYKELIQENSSFNVEPVNAELTKYLQDVRYLKSLDGKKVRGGKLGKYFSQVSGNVIGGFAGSAFGGPIGSAVGSIVGGELGGRIKGKMMESTFGTGGEAPQKSPILEQAKTQSNNLGNRNTIYNPTSISTSIDIPSKLPRFSQKTIRPETQIHEVKTEIQLYETLLDQSPAKELMKFSNKNGELPEVTGKGLSKFGRKGDDIVKSLGFSDTNEAIQAYEVYRKNRQRLAELKTKLSNIKKQTFVDYTDEQIDSINELFDLTREGIIHSL